MFPPKTIRYRGKVYGISGTGYYKTRKSAERIIETAKERKQKKGVKFFTTVKNYPDSNGKDRYVIYWRAEFSKTHTKKRQAEQRKLRK